MSCILDTPANKRIASGLNMSLESYRALVSTLSVKDPDLENRIENLSEEEVVLALQQKLQNEIRYTIDKDVYDIINTLYDTYKDGDISDVIGSDIENLLSSIKDSLFYYVASDGKDKIHLFKTEFINTSSKNDEQSRLKRDAELFLSNFGLTLNDLDSYNEDVPLFDALNRVINAKTDTDITEGVGYAIAFMMQHDPTFRDAVAFSKSNSQGIKGISRNLNRVLLQGNNRQRPLGTEENLRFIGSEIAKELRKLYNIDTDNITGEKVEKESLFKKIWDIIDRFFQLLSDSQLRTRLTNAALYTKNAAKAVKNNDKSFIVKDNIKPGSDKEGTALDIQQAIKDNPYEASIVELMTKHGIALGGSASIASKGTIYRYADNPLHDLDFNAKGKTEEEVENILKQNFKFYIKTNVIEDNDPNDPERRTLTYLVIDREVKEEQIPGTKAVNIIDVETGETIGRREYSDLVLKDGVQGKMLDFFMGDTKNNFTNTTNITINGKDYLFADPRNAFLFKINVAREKDIFDYNRYVPYAEEPLDENESVKYNKNTSIELLDFLKNHLFAVDFESPDGDKKVLRSLVHSFKNKFNEAWLTKLTRHDPIKKDEVYDQYIAKRLVSNYLRQVGLDDAIVLIDTPNATKVRVYEYRLIDAIEEHSKIEDIGTPIPDSKWEHSLLGFLSKRLGVEFKHITVAEAKKLLGDKYNSKINAFNLNGTAYFIKGKKINADIKSEEMLHPFIASMHKYNPEVFDDLLKDAKQNFKKLYLGILNTYDESEADEELVTQALARVFVEEKQKNKKPFVAKMIAKFKQWLVSMFSSEPTLKLGDATLKDIAQLINSDAELIYKKVANLSFNKDYVQTSLFNDNNNNTIQSSISQSDTTINIYAGTNENTELSNKEVKEEKEKEEKPESFDKTVESALSIKDGVITIEPNSTKEQLNESIKRFVNDYRNPLYQILSIDVTSCKTVEDLIQLIQTLNKQKGRLIYSYYDGEETFKSLPKEWQEKLKEKDITYIPVYTFGGTYNEIQIREQTNNIINAENKGELLFHSSELRNWGRSAFAQFHYNLELLKQMPEANEQFFGDKFKNENFLNNTTEEILNKIGVANALEYLLKEPVFNVSKNTASLSSRLLSKKMSVIYNNFKGFVNMNYDHLLLFDNIELTDTSSKSHIDTIQETQADIEDVEKQDEIEIAEEYGSSQEHWQIGFRSVSPHNSLSQKIRDRLNMLLDLDENGIAQKNELGLNKLIDVHEAVNQILLFTQDSESLDNKKEDGTYETTSMVHKLQQHISEHKWLEQLVGKHYISGNDTLDEIDGILVSNDPVNEQFKSLFYNNFQKHFQKYNILYNDGQNTILKTINLSDFTSDTLIDIKNRFEDKEDGKLSMFDITSNSFKLNVAQTFSQKLREISSKLATQSDTLNNDDLNLLFNAYVNLDISVPPFDTFSRTINTLNKTTLQKVVNAASYIFDNIYMNAQNNSNYEYLNSSNKSNFKQLTEAIALAMASDMESVFHQDGKSYYSYVQPAYLNKLINKLSGKTENYEKFIQDEYKQYSGWFTFVNKKGETVWLNDWLQKLATKKEAKGILDHAVLLSDNGVGYTDKTPAQYFSSILSNYFYSSSAKDTAWFRVGILSNKPSEEYIKFYKYSGVGFEDVICEKLFRQTFSQEVFRIKAVRERKKVAKEYEKLQNSLNDENLTEEERVNIEQQIKNLNYSKENEIANFDKNGDKFFFLEFLNDEIKNNTELGKAVNRVINENTEIIDIEYNGSVYHSDLEFLKTELPKAIRNYLEEHYESFKREQANNGAFELNEDGTYKSSDDKNIRSVLKDKGEEGLKEFYFNDFFAQVNITQLTITDLSFYKNTEDLQKRLAQLHAPSIKPNINATFNGEKVSDGKFRTVYIKDSIVESDIIPNLMASAEVILNSNGLKNNPLLKSQVKARLDNIIKQFKEINWADAQGYTSPTAYRKRMIMYGKWSERDQRAYEQVLSGNVDVENLDILWQPLKPFGYSQIGVSGHNKYMPKIKMGIQNKNSEYLLIMADAIMRGANINNKLSAIYDVMEDSYKRGNKSKGIDAIQFESTVKVGKRSVIDINNINTSDEIKKVFNDKLYLNDTYNTEYVQEYDFEDYGIQQEVPSHFEGSQQHGSQVRILAVSDIPSYNSFGEENHVMVNGESKSVSEARKNYFEAIDRNIQRSIDDIKKQFHLDDINPKLRNKAISDMLRNEILKDNRYGNDLLWACSLNENGDFNIPLSDPIHSNRIQQLLNSIVKNRVWKQKIAGGPVVQVSSYGLSEDLHIRFNDKNGNLLKTYDEFIKENPNGDYNKYVKENSKSLAYLECYVPIYDESLLSDFMKDDGTIDVEAMEKNNPDLLNMFGYRIPTESKYSMVPIKIKGFLPRNAGEGIMLPKEITLLSGSDFDIDKLYVMRYEFLRQESYPTPKLKAYKDTIKEATGKDYSLDQIADHLHGKSFVEDKNVSSLLAKIAKPDYKYIKQTNGRGGDNNTILDYSIAFLTSETAFEQFFTPGNFDEPKRVGYLIQACKNTGEDYKELSKLSIDELKNKAYQKQSLLFIDTQIRFHRQNMVAGKLIGAFAQANVSHSFVSTWHDMNSSLENTPLCGIDVPPMIINGNSYNGLTPIDNEYENFGINRVSNNLSSYLAASVDAVKDPILNLMNINMNTVNLAISLIRLGESIETVGLLLSHPAVINAVNNGDLQNNGQGLFDTISELEKSTRVSDVIDISNEWLAQQLIRPSDTADQITQNKHSDLLVLKAIQNLIPVANTIRSITTATRLNSISSAVGPFISDTVIQQVNLQEFSDTIDETITPLITDMLYNTPIISTIYKGVHQDIVPKLFDDVMLTDSETLAKLFKEIENRLGYCNKKIARKFTDFLSSYIQCLDGTSVFDMSDENRDYILNKFPQEFKDTKIKYPDNKLVQAVKIVFDNNNNQMLEIKTRGYSSDQIEDLKKAWEELWNVDKNLAEKLVEYNFFKGSFTFNPRTFMQLVPNSIKLKLNNYIDNQLDFNPDNFDISTCIDQFMVMNGLAEKYFKDETSFNAFVREYLAPTNNGESKDVFRHIIVKFGDNLMYVSPIIQGGFTQIDNLGCGNKIFEIDPSRAVYEIRTVMSNKSSESDGETSKLQSDEITQPLSTNDAEILQRITVKDLIGEDVYDTFGNNTAELIKSVKTQFNNLSFFGNELKQRTGLTENALQTIKRRLDKISTNEPITLEQLNKTINEINPC